MEGIDSTGASDASAGMYFTLMLGDFVASHLPKQEKTSRRVKTSRDLRVQVNIADMMYMLDWKPFAEQISWPASSGIVSHIAHRGSTVFFEVYARFSHEDHQVILSSEVMTVEALVERLWHSARFSFDLKPESALEDDNTPIATISLSLSAAPFANWTRSDIPKVILSQLGPRERWARLVDPLQSIIRVGTGIAEVNSNAKIALSCVKVACETFLKPFEIDEKVLKLMTDVEAALRLVLEVDTEGAKDLTPVQKSLLGDLMRQANECILFMGEYSKQSYLKIVVKVLVKNYNTIIADYTRSLHSLTQQFNNSELRNIQVVVHRLVNQVQDIGNSVDVLMLDRLEITKGAGRNPNKMCLDGTRVSVLERVHTWIHGGGKGANARILLAIGQAGVGKSAIAHTIANEYADMGRLGAAFCFSKDRGAGNLFRTIARNLADIDPVYASVLSSSSISSEMATSTSLEIQMKLLLLVPFQRLSVIGPVVIVLDALDECAERNQLINCLIKNINSLPDNIRILVTSRPTEAHRLREQPWVTVLNLEDEPPSDEDILCYVQNRLKSQMSGPATMHGLQERDVKDIASRSEGLFQYASVVCSEILSSYLYEWPSGERETPKQTFVHLVKDRKGGLDMLYSGLLEKLYPSTMADSQGLQDFRSVMSWILAAQERLTHKALVEFGYCLDSSNFDDLGGYSRVSMTLRPLGALLSGTQEGSTVVYPLHSSIRNFLTDKERSGRFYIGSETEQHHSLASISLRLLVTPGRLRFNIAGLESSYLCNKDVSDFKTRVSTAVSAGLSYSCRYWAEHLRLSLTSPAEFERLADIGTLMNEKFLFWLEVLGLLGKTSFAEDACQMLIFWLTDMHSVSTVTLERINLCLKFVRNYGKIIEHATPHLYLSALPQTPDILDTALHQFTALPKVIRSSRGATDSSDPSTTYMTLHGHTDMVCCVGFSHDGQYIVTGSCDKTARIWDTQTYSQAGDPLTGHIKDVSSASFSPDGKLVVSASYDDTVRIWNAKSKAHEQVGESFTGHTDVCKALFLPNGTHVVSASVDTILFWDAVTHAEISQPLRSRGLAFAVSPDGSCIALQRGDGSTSLEIRAIPTGAQIRQLLTGHCSLVTAVAFSPDGQDIITADEFTLRTWDAKTGALINVMDVTGDSMYQIVYGIIFYLDDRHIMTLQEDDIQFWDMNTQSQILHDISREIGASGSAGISPNGNQIAAFESGSKSVQIWTFDPLSDHLTRAHDFTLTSASYSPDGTYIATACTDNSVRIWDAATCSQVGNPLIGHTDEVNSTSFSPDGKLIVTASEDGTVRVWNAQTGAQIVEPLTGHTAPVVSALFSPGGTCLLSADDSNIRVWSAGRSDLGMLIQVIKLSLQLPKDYCTMTEPISFSPYGQFLTANTQDYTQVVDLNTGSEAAIIPPEYRNRCACFSWDEHLMLFFGRQDSNLHLWNAELHRLEKVFKGHTRTVLRASFSPDRKHIVSASKDHTIRVWSTEAGCQTAVYQNWGKVHNLWYLKTLAVSPDGRHILSVYNDYETHIQIWAMPDSLPPGTDLRYSADDPNPWRRAVINKGRTTSLVGHTKDDSGQRKEILFCAAGDEGSLMWLPCHVGVINPEGPPVRIFWENSVHGTDWTRCYLGERDS